MNRRQTVKILAWRFDHVGDCNRYGNCVDHPYFELPNREELIDYPQTLPSGCTGLEYVPADSVTSADGLTEDSLQAFAQLRNRSEGLRAAVGEALHSIQRNRMHEVSDILDAAVTDFDRVWNFEAAEHH